MFNLDQAFALRDEGEETGLDFQDYYYLYRCILAVKQYGVDDYGSLGEDEWEDLMKKHPFFS